MCGCHRRGHGDRRAPGRGRRPRSTACWPRLAATFGGSRLLGADDVEPFLGEAGGVPPWELTDAIDAGNTVLALETLAG